MVMPKIEVLPGTLFGKWKIIQEAPRGILNQRRFECECECGTKKVIGLAHLRTRSTVQCSDCIVLARKYR